MLHNAIVVMFDSLQFNYLGCYGNEWIKTPNMDRLAREGVLFENCYSEGLPTIPCRRSMHTGRFTLPVSGWSPLTMEDTTIADLCWGRPIDTALIFDCPMYRQPKFGYTRGFDKVWFTHGHEMDHYFYEKDPLFHYDPENFSSPSARQGVRQQYSESVVASQTEEIICYLKQMQYWNSEDDRYVARTMKKAVEYLEQIDRNKQFYLWIDSFDPHEPWNPPSTYMGFPCPYDPDYQGANDIMPFIGEVKGVYSEEEMRHIRMLYAELVTVCDTWLGYLMDAMRRLGLEENTLLMMVSDHGEPMGNGEHGHGIMRKCRPWPYEELSHIPMLLRAPGLPAGKRVPSFVQSCDVAPTICDWLGIGVHPDMQGKSLLSLAKGEVEKVRDFAIAGYYRFGWGLFTEDWAYMHWPAKDGWMEYVGGAMQTAIESVGVKFEGSATPDAVRRAQDGVQSDALQRHREAATIDGEAQWTCTPGAAAVVPEGDELYSRRTDPFQLHNVIDQNPGVASELLQTLRSFMSELRAS